MKYTKKRKGNLFNLFIFIVELHEDKVKKKLFYIGNFHNAKKAASLCLLLFLFYLSNFNTIVLRAATVT